MVGPNSEAVNVLEEIMSDPSISVRATVNACGTDHQPPLTNAWGHLMRAQQQRQWQHWTKLKLHGKLESLPAADHDDFHVVLKSAAVMRTLSSSL